MLTSGHSLGSSSGCAFPRDVSGHATGHDISPAVWPFTGLFKPLKNANTLGSKVSFCGLASSRLRPAQHIPGGLASDQRGLHAHTAVSAAAGMPGGLHDTSRTDVSLLKNVKPQPFINKFANLWSSWFTGSPLVHLNCIHCMQQYFLKGSRVYIGRPTVTA